MQSLGAIVAFLPGLPIQPRGIDLQASTPIMTSGTAGTPLP